MNSPDPVASFLMEFPLKTRWVNDIVDILQNTHNGKAHVREIAKRLAGNRKVDEMEATITRAINDYCSDAQDFKKTPQHDLFQRVEPATYRLRSYPAAPNTLDLIDVSFEDAAMHQMWEMFAKACKDKDRTKWENAGTHRKLTAFAKFMAPGTERRKHYEDLKAAYDSMSSFDLGL